MGVVGNIGKNAPINPRATLIHPKHINIVFLKCIYVDKPDA